MCKWGTYETVWVRIPPDLSHSGQHRWAAKPIDACIAPIVAGLNVAGVVTRSSCCGHGKGDGEVVLGDGRRVVIRAGERTPKVGAA